MSSSRRDSRADQPIVSLQPPSPDLPSTQSGRHTRNSSSGGSIPSHNSDIYVNSYYYGNEEMPELALGASTATLPSWAASRSSSPSGSSRIGSNDQGLMRRLSWGSRDQAPSLIQDGQSPLPGQHQSDSRHHLHERSASSADAGLVRDPLDIAFHDTPDITLSEDFDNYVENSRVSLSGPSEVPLHRPSGISISSMPMGGERGTQEDFFDGDDADRAILTSHQSRPGFTRFASADGHDFARVDSPDQLEHGEARPTYRSSSDVYTAAGLSEGTSMQRAKTGLHRVSKSIRRISRRVVHLDDDRGHILLAGEDDDDSESYNERESRAQTQQAAESTDTSAGTTELPIQTLRGKSLGVWSPDSKFRKALANLLSHWWIEPAILLVIVANIIVLVVQSGRDVFKHPRKASYFDYVEDYMLLAIFCIYTIEITARIVVSGLVINPPPIYVAQDPGSQDEVGDVTSKSEMHREHRRQMSKSNTLDAFADLGGSLKDRAQRAFASSDRSASYKSPAAYRMAKSSSDEGASPKNPPLSRLGSEDLLPPGHTLARSNTAMMLPSADAASFWKNKKAPFAEAIMTQRVQAVHHAYLRHSWNRVDLLAVVCFWIAFGLSMARQEHTDNHRIYVFRALSVLRCTRLLTATSGTSTILQSLKAAGPILFNAACFTLFAMLLFSIIGVQSFKGSYRRSCVWVGNLSGQPGTNYTLSNFCGGHQIEGGNRTGYIRVDGAPSGASAKGFICPLGQICQEADENPENNTMSFDSIFHSLLQVVIIISSNNWSSTMYDMIDADYFVSCLFFIFGLIIMNFWLANLFVAVITNSFASLTAKTNRSAFANQKINAKPVTDSKPKVGQRMRRVASVYKRIWGYTKYLWILTILTDVGVQAFKATYLQPRDLEIREKAELYFTLAFDVEILMRFLAFVLDGDWRSFVRSKQNRADLFLAVVTSIIQIPVIKDSSVYPWLTAFQLARFYRVIAAAPRMRALLVRVFGSMVALLNMVLFLLITVGLASLIAVQMFRGDIPQESDGEHVQMNFKHVFNSFLAMYQIFTSEDWTTVLYSVLSNEQQFRQAVLGGIFLSGWFLFANFIVLQMFIAVINENFSVAEGEKRQQQLEHYLRRNEPPEDSGTAKFLNRFSPYRYLRKRQEARLASALPGSDYAGTEDEGRSNVITGGDGLNNEKGRRKSLQNIVGAGGSTAQKTLNTFKRALRLDTPEEVVPLDTVRAKHFRQSLSGEEMLRSGGRQTMDFDANTNDQAAKLFANERQLTRMRTDLGLPIDKEASNRQFQSSYAERGLNDPRIQQAKLIASHPSYDKSYFLFSNHNRFRRFCQSLVPSSHGERLFGRPVSPTRHRVFQIIIFLGIAGSVTSAAFATPAYRREYYEDYGMIRASWFSLLEISLSTLFVAEFFVKTIADGFAFTPNAYVLSVWNSLDLFVLITLLINVSSELAVIGGVSRFTRALKAFRALRLINLSSLMRDTFHAVMIAGAGRIIDASILAILYIIPYAIWGQNLFGGLLYSCNDSGDSISSKFNCTGEFSVSPGEWSFLAPRVWANPRDGSVYSFDDFKSSLLILFEIISLEGWIDVMSAAMSIAGKDRQLEDDNRQVNALFFLIYNLVGSTTVLTLFVAVIIENFQTFSGAAYQTAEQRKWIDLKRLIMRQKPSKRPRVQPTNPMRVWCYERAIQKHGWWSWGMTALYLVNIIILMTQRYSDPDWVDQLRDLIYLAFALIYAVDLVIRLAGLGWRSFRENPWNIYDLIVVVGTLGSTIPLLQSTPAGNQINVQFQKIFLTCVAFKLVQKNNALNQLFKTAVSSLPAILSLFLLWLTMFLVWAIMLVEVFGLTKWGANETYSRNFSTLVGSLVFLSMMSTGEGWNSYMHDYTVSPPQCTPSANYLKSDCGSKSWAFFLFITWNVISMYIFLNMFTGTVVENFSYIFDMGSKKSLTREEMRAYKAAWAKFDKERRGYIHQNDLIPFFRSLTGVLEVGRYPPNCSLKELRGALESNTPLVSPVSPSKPGKGALDRLRGNSPFKSPAKEGHLGEKGHFMWPHSPTTLEPNGGTDAQRLNWAMSKVDLDDLKMRRTRFNRLYHEAVLTQHDRKGISFNKMLKLLARYKLINDEEALGVEELIRRRETLEKVDDRVNLERLRGVMRMVYLRRRYLALRDEKHRSMSDPGRFSRPDVPAIVVDSVSTMSKKPTVPLDINFGSGPAIPSSSSELPSDQSLSPSQPTLAELEERASPIIESFAATAWGDVMRRISQSEASSSSRSQFRNELRPGPEGSWAGSDHSQETEEKTSLRPGHT